jgi:hypothetical protein
LIGPVILDDPMMGHNYLDFLDYQNKHRIFLWLHGLLCTFSMTEPLVIIHDLWCNTCDTFPNQWIGCGNTLNWPPRSPDLTSLDFYLCGWVKSELYRRKIDIWDKLLDHIKEHQDALRWATHHVLTQAAKYVDAEDGISENVLYWVNCTIFVTWTINICIRNRM